MPFSAATRAKLDRAIHERDGRAFEQRLAPIKTWSNSAIWTAVDPLLQAVTEQGWHEGSDRLIQSLPEALHALGKRKRQVWALNADQDHLLSHDVPTDTTLFAAALAYRAHRALLRLLEAGTLDLPDGAPEDVIIAAKHQVNETAMTLTAGGNLIVDDAVVGSALHRLADHAMIQEEELYGIMAWAIHRDDNPLYQRALGRLGDRTMDPDQSLGASHVLATCVWEQRLDLLADLVGRHGLTVDGTLVLLYHAVDDGNREAVRWLVRHHEAIFPMSSHHAAKLLVRAMDPKHAEPFQRDVVDAFAQVDANDLFTRAWDHLDEEQVWDDDPKRESLIFLAPPTLQQAWLDARPDLYAGARARLREKNTLDTVAPPGGSRTRPRA